MTERPDYAQLIDAETWDFIEKTAQAYPENTATGSIADQRAAYDAMCQVFYAGRPDGVSVADHRANHVPVRHYGARETDAPMILYMHGGGFVVGGLHSHDDVCAELCDATGYDVVSVDYQLAPEHKHPAAFDDCMIALNWARDRFAKDIILVGDSAGGNLAAALAHETRGSSDILGQILIYPGLGGDRDAGSYLYHANAPGLTRDEILFYETNRVDGEMPIGDARLMPLSDASFANLPPTVTIAAGCDPLCDDGRVYCEHILAAGGQAVWIEEPGLIHGYLRARHSVGRARDSFARIIRAIEMIGTGQPLDEDALRR